MAEIPKEMRGGMKEVIDAARGVDGDGKMVGSDEGVRCRVTVLLKSKGWRAWLVEVVSVVKGLLM